MLNAYSKAAAERDAAKAKSAGAEFIIAYTHWGRENTHSVTAGQRRHAKEMADAGIDLILGAHPHCLQRAQIISAADGRDVLCVYSLGNFVSSMARAINNDTAILSIRLKRTGGAVELTDAGYYPCHVMSNRKNGRFVVMPAQSKWNAGLASAGLESARRRIAAALGDVLREIA